MNVVTTPEEMPVAETIELVAKLRTDVNVPLGSVIVNRVLPELFTRADEETFEALRAPLPTERLTAGVGRGATDVLDAARLAVNLRRTRATHLPRLRVPVTVVAVLVALGATGLVSGWLGKSPLSRPFWRNVIGGSVAMAVPYGIGSLVGRVV